MDAKDAKAAKDFVSVSIGTIDVIPSVSEGSTLRQSWASYETRNVDPSLTLGMTGAARVSFAPFASIASFAVFSGSSAMMAWSPVTLRPPVCSAVHHRGMLPALGAPRIGPSTRSA